MLTDKEYSEKHRNNFTCNCKHCRERLKDTSLGDFMVDAIAPPMKVAGVITDSEHTLHGSAIHRESVRNACAVCHTLLVQDWNEVVAGGFYGGEHHSPYHTKNGSYCPNCGTKNVGDVE